MAAAHQSRNSLDQDHHPLTVERGFTEPVALHLLPPRERGGQGPGLASPADLTQAGHRNQATTSQAFVCWGPHRTPLASAGEAERVLGGAMAPRGLRNSCPGPAGRWGGGEKPFTRETAPLAESAGPSGMGGQMDTHDIRNCHHPKGLAQGQRTAFLP